jgi:hypothetical protein
MPYKPLTADKKKSSKIRTFFPNSLARHLPFLLAGRQ